MVHRLVAMAFIGPVPDGKEVNHIDGDKHNNAADNLEYLPRVENMAHAVRIGLLNNFGENNPSARLTNEQVAQIKREYMPGGQRHGGNGYKSLAAKYGVTWEAIRNIIKGRAWQTAA